MTPETTQQKLELLIRRWERRLRTRRILLYLPRVLMATLGIALFTTAFVMLLQVLPTQTLMWIVFGLVASSAAITVGFLALFGKQGLRSAQQFDQIYGLQERLSTALELIEGRIETTPEIAALQIEDAYALAQDVDPRKHIKIQMRWIEWLGVLVLAMALGFLFALASFSIAGSGISAAQQQAIDSAADDVRDIIEELATDTSLEGEERETLLESLEVSLDDLQMPEASPEEAFASMSELESDLRAEVEDLQAEIAERQQALDELAASFEDALNNLDFSEFASDEASAEGLQASMEELLNAVNEMSPAQREQLAEALQAAAEAALEELPDLSEQLAQAADALEQGDNPLADEAFQEALNELREQLETQSQQQAASDTLDAAADTVQEAAEEIAQAEQQPADGQQPQDAQQGGDAETFQAPPPPDGDQNAEEAQPQQGAEAEIGQENQQQGQQPQPGEGEGQPQDQGDPQPGQQGQLQQGAPQQGQQQSAVTEGSSESGSSQASSDGEERDPGLSDEAVNSAESAGESDYDPIFAPRDLGLDGQTDVVLEPDASDAPVVEGDFNENPEGDATVPYDQVFSQYSDAANRALESDYVPLGLRDVVRDYFTALEPDSTSGE